MQFCCLDYFYLKNTEDRLSSCPFIFVSTRVLATVMLHRTHEVLLVVSDIKMLISPTVRLPGVTVVWDTSRQTG